MYDCPLGGHVRCYLTHSDRHRQGQIMSYVALVYTLELHILPTVDLHKS